MVDYRIVVPSGIVFDFNNMLGAGRLQPQEVEQALAGSRSREGCV